MERPEAALKPRLHLLNDLTAILFALKLSLRGDDGLDELAFRGVFELEVQALARRAVGGEFRAQANVKLRVAGEPLEVIEDHHVPDAGIAAQILEQGHHAGAAHEIAACGFSVEENLLDGVAALRGVFAAAVLLAVQPVSVRLLLPVGNAAVDEG